MELRTIVRNLQQNGCRVRIHCYFCVVGFHWKALNINKYRKLGTKEYQQTFNTN